MKINQYLDSTYLKTAAQAGISETENIEIVKKFTQEAIEEQFKLIMIRPDMVAMTRKMIDQQKSTVLVGTVISFPDGDNTLEDKLQEATTAIQNGADELDYVCNYKAFKNGEIELVKKEILEGTQLAFQNHKVAKWIIEVAALTDAEIIQLSALIKQVIMANFKESSYGNVFVKSSTGFYQTEKGKPNGATVPTIIMMIENASPLPVKAAGGVRTYDEAIEMIQLGVKRIGTSAAHTIAHGGTATSTY